MKNLSGSLTRSRSCHALVVLWADTRLILQQRCTTAPNRRAPSRMGIDFDSAPEKGMALGVPEDTTTFIPVL